MGSILIRAADTSSERSEVWLSRQFGELEIVGSNPTVLTERTKRHRAEVQLGARLVWDQEVFGSTPRCPTFTSSDLFAQG